MLTQIFKPLTLKQRDSQYHIDLIEIRLAGGYSQVREDISIEQLTEDKLSNIPESVFVEVILRKIM